MEGPTPANQSASPPSWSPVARASTARSRTSLCTCPLPSRPRAQEVLVGVVESGAATCPAPRPLRARRRKTAPDAAVPSPWSALRFTLPSATAVPLARTGYTGEDGLMQPLRRGGRRGPVDWSSPVPRRPWSPPSSTASRCQLTPLRAGGARLATGGRDALVRARHEGMTPYDAGLARWCGSTRATRSDDDAAAARRGGHRGNLGAGSRPLRATRPGRCAGTGDDGEGFRRRDFGSPTLGHPGPWPSCVPGMRTPPPGLWARRSVADAARQAAEVTVVDFYKRPDKARPAPPPPDRKAIHHGQSVRAHLRYSIDHESG